MIVFVLLIVIWSNASSVLAQTKIELTDNQKYIMIQDVQGDPDQHEQVFGIDNRSNILLDGSENYYSISMKEPHEGDAFGIKVKGEYCVNDTIRRVTFTHCGGGIYGGPWGGEGGLVDDCIFIENDRWGIRFGRFPNLGLEIRNCLFEDNNNGLDMKCVQSMWVHDNQFTADTSRGIVLESRAEYTSRDNIIEHNVFTGHDSYGIEVTEEAVSNTIRENLFINDPIRVDNADNNLFVGNFITDCDTAIWVTGCVGNVFEKDTVENSTNYDVLLGNAAEVSFIASIFDTQKVNFADSESKLLVKWYLDVTVTNGGPIEGAIVKCYNKDGSLIAETITGTDGKTDTLVLPQFVMDSTTTLFYTPYSVVTSKEGYGTDTTNVDLTESKSVEITLTSTGVAEFERMGIPHHFALEQNYPNPFNPSTLISYQLPKTSKVILKIYSINGQLVKTLINEFQNAGKYTVKWDGKDRNGKMIPSGIYIYSLIGDDYMESRRMVLLR